MSVVEEEKFVALGGKGITIAFECRGTSFGNGGLMTGNNIGLHAQARLPGPDNPFDQTGVFGTARFGPGVVGATNNHYGVFGQFGESAPDPQAGLHDKSAEIVCGFERVRRFLFCSARKSRSALIQLARFDCVCGDYVPFQSASQRSHVWRTAPVADRRVGIQKISVSNY